MVRLFSSSGVRRVRRFASLSYVWRGSVSEGMGGLKAGSSSSPACSISGSTSGSKTSGISLEYLGNSNSRLSSMGPLGVDTPRLLPGEAQGNFFLVQVFLNTFDGIGAVMNHGSDESGVRSSLGEHFGQVFGMAGPPGGDDRDGNRLGNHAGERQFIPCLGAVGVDGVEANFAGAQGRPSP